MRDLLQVTRAHGIGQRIILGAHGVGPRIHSDACVILVAWTFVLGGVYLVVGDRDTEVDVAS